MAAGNWVISHRKEEEEESLTLPGVACHSGTLA